MAYDRHHGDGALYRVDPDLSVVVVLDGVRISKGVDWSSREGLAADDDPLAGALFRVVPGVRGEPVREFPG
jgi:hypothetical protein